MKETEERLSLRDAADALGISEVTARRWVKSGKLKAYQPGRKYLIPTSDVERLLQETKAPKGPALRPWRDQLRALDRGRKRDLALAAQGVVGGMWLGATGTREIMALNNFAAEHGVTAADVLEELASETPGLRETLEKLEESGRVRAEAAKASVEAALRHAADA